MTIIFILIWISFSCFLAAYADYKKIGFFKILLISLVASPVVGFVFALILEPEKKKPVQPPNVINNITMNQKDTKLDKLMKLHKLRKEGGLTEDEYIQLKEGLFQS